MAFNKARVLQEADSLANQGKIRQAITRYFSIFERDPSELILLNTIGDLYIRDRNVSEGLKQFYRLAEAYARGGFTLKAIAIYKKIVKLDPDPVGPLLKLIELYQAQRLAREARELYYQVAECYKKKKQTDKALETLRKAVQLDVENRTATARLAAFCEEVGRKDEAPLVYMENAQLALRRGDTGAAQIALKRARELAPDDPQIPLLMAREALVRKHPEDSEAILSGTPGLTKDPAGRSLLIDSYLAMQQPEKAETLVLDVFRAAPADFSPLASFVSVCVQLGRFETASKVLSAVADELIAQGNTSSLMESLRLIRSKSPQHLPIDLATLDPSAIPTGPSSEIQEIDLSEDSEVLLAQRAKSSQGLQAPQKAPSPQSREGDETVREPSPEDDPEAHYNLGVAFWEMNLPDEAIRELQQVVKGAGIRPQPPNYLEACTLLAACFMDKGMASVAVKWYGRALQAPHLDEEAWLALHYDLGVAYERTGDLPRAWEEFSEVYSRNIAFRDVAEKVRTFQQKGSSR